MPIQKLKYFIDILIAPFFVCITGASGVGKTATLQQFQKELVEPEEISINYFDDIGVPTFDTMRAEYGSAEKWQEATTHFWIKKLSTITDKKLIILEGSFNPDFAVDQFKNLGITQYAIIDIHAEKSVREKRLLELRNQPELITDAMDNWAEFLKKKTLLLHGFVIQSNKDVIGKTVDELVSILITLLESNV